MSVTATLMSAAALIAWNWCRNAQFVMHLGSMSHAQLLPHRWGRGGTSDDVGGFVVSWHIIRFQLDSCLTIVLANPFMQYRCLQNTDRHLFLYGRALSSICIMLAGPYVPAIRRMGTSKISSLYHWPIRLPPIANDSTLQFHGILSKTNIPLSLNAGQELPNLF